MKQLTVLQLIYQLTKMFLRVGNVSVYYHNYYNPEDTWDCPMEVEGLEVRKAKSEDMLTIY